MKAIRLITFVIVFAIAFSVWTPAPALAKPVENGPGSSAELTKKTVINLTVLNRTFGALTLMLDGPEGVYLFIVNKGKTTYSIKPGKYTYTVSYASSNPCKNWSFPKNSTSITKTRDFVNSKNTLGPYKFCSVG